MFAELERYADLQPKVRSRLTAEEFLIACDAGAFGDMHVELVDGDIVEMPPEGNTHSRNVWQTGKVLDRIVERLPGLEIGSNLAVRLGPGRVVGPDIAVYDVLSPQPEMTPRSAVRLAVEHSYSARSYDLNRKSGLYAEAGVPEYWVLDVLQVRLHRFHTPIDGRYTRDPPLGPDARVGVPFASGEVLRVGDLFRL